MAASNVDVPNEVVEFIKGMKLAKLDKKYTFIILKFDDTWTKLQIAEKSTGSFNDFVSSIKKNYAKVGCYAVCDVPLKSSGSKLCLFAWAPDEISVKWRMLVASSFGSLKGKLDGVDCYEAHSLSDLDLDQIQKKIERKF